MLCDWRPCVFLVVLLVSAHVLCFATSPTDLDRQLAIRGSGVKFSFYDVGLGACGVVNRASDFIVALNRAQFDSGDWCFKTIIIRYGGKSAQAKVMDMCPGCPYRGLDLSKGLFDYFASESKGIIYGEWTTSEHAQQQKLTTSKNKAKKLRLKPTADPAAIVDTSGSEEDSASDTMFAASEEIARVSGEVQAPSSVGYLKGRLESIFEGLGRLELTAARIFMEGMTTLDS